VYRPLAGDPLVHAFSRLRLVHRRRDSDLSREDVREIAPGHLRIRRGLLLAAAASALLFAPTLIAQPLRARDNEVKAVYLLNFGRFARWPLTASPAPAAGFAVCVLGRDPFGPTLDAVVDGETIDGRPVVARRLTSGSNAAGCRILFISLSEGVNLKKILQSIDRTPMLTVSELPQFAEQGGMIQFVSEGNRVRFAVNVTATEDAGLMLSSELLRVALTIKGSKPPKG
jgi:hypothetical protein